MDGALGAACGRAVNRTGFEHKAPERLNSQSGLVDKAEKSASQG